jgi:hypothetical protein
MPAKLPAALVKLARKEVGVTEVRNSNCGPRVNEYKAATNLPPDQSWPWCAAFICFLVREAQTKLKPGHDIKAGDIVVFTFSHIGLAVADAKDGEVLTIEGNTDLAGSREGGGVFQKRRPLSKVRARIRFTL